MNNQNLEKGVFTTFYSTLVKKDDENPIDSIVIPKIQRDYAQGRISATRIRQNFLNALYGAIDEETSQPIELDFIYGDLDKKTNIFYPLDGQQRLTTLFLLHWYLAKRLGVSNAQFLKKFSYQTRESSKEFCVKLLELEPDFDIPMDDFIKDRSWYTKTWASDPTIASMLVVIGAIDQHYKTFDQNQLNVVWSNLIGHDDKLGNIRFYRLYIENLETTDDLYIKMNSRGKPLTDFEHFKAELSKYTKDYPQFILNIDTNWTTLLWSYRNAANDADPNKYEDNGLDKSFLNLFRAYLTIEGVKEEFFYDDDTKNFSDFDMLARVLGTNKRMQFLKRLNKILDFFYLQYQHYGSVRSFFEVFLTGQPCSESKVFINESKITNIDLVSNLCNLHHGRPNLLLAEAFFECAVKYEGQEVDLWKDEFCNSIRIVRNLMVNSTDDIRKETMKDLLNRVDAIIAVGDLAVDIADFTKRQKEQEILKVKWMKDNQQDVTSMLAAENHQLLYGNLKPLIDGNGFDAERMRKFVSVFSSWERLSLIERGLLSVGDYGYYQGARYNYGGQNFDCNGEWRTTVFVNNNNVTPLILQTFLDALSSEPTDEEIESIIDTFISECNSEERYPWAYYLVAHQGMRHGRSGKYYPSSDRMIYDRIMMKEHNFNGFHWNPFLFCLSKKIEGSSIGNYNAHLVLPNGVSELSCHEDHYILYIANEPNRKIMIPQDGDGIDVVDRINYLMPQEGEDLMQHLRNRSVIME